MRWPLDCCPTHPEDVYQSDLWGGYKSLRMHAEHSFLTQTDPTRFVSGGDDCTVRLWSIREEAPTAVIDAKANVCSVQFSPTSSNLLAFGSANYRVYLYDLRQMQVGVPHRSAVADLHISRIPGVRLPIKWLRGWFLPSAKLRRGPASYFPATLWQDCHS